MASSDGRALLIFAVGSLPLLLLELSRSDLSPGDRFFLDTVNVVVLMVFAFDYVVELGLAKQRLAYVRGEWTSLLIVIAQAAVFLPGLGGAGIFRALRAGRAWRSVAVLARVVAIGGAAAAEGRAILRRHAARFALGVAGFTWITAATALTLAEIKAPGTKVESFFDALWWSSATITTVGYGDVYPVTGVGRLIGGVAMVVGISTFAIVTAKVAEYLVRSNEADPAAET